MFSQRQKDEWADLAQLDMCSEPAVSVDVSWPWLSSRQKECTRTFPRARLRNLNLVSKYRRLTASGLSMNSPLMHRHMK